MVGAELGSTTPPFGMDAKVNKWMKTDKTNTLTHIPLGSANVPSDSRSNIIDDSRGKTVSLSDSKVSDSVKQCNKDCHSSYENIDDKYITYLRKK